MAWESRLPLVYLKLVEIRALGEAVAAEESPASAWSVGLIARKFPVAGFTGKPPSPSCSRRPWLGLGSELGLGLGQS